MDVWIVCHLLILTDGTEEGTNDQDSEAGMIKPILLLVLEIHRHTEKKVQAIHICTLKF